MVAHSKVYDCVGGCKHILVHAYDIALWEREEITRNGVCRGFCFASSLRIAFNRVKPEESMIA